VSVNKGCIRGGGKLKVNYFEMLSQRYDRQDIKQEGLEKYPDKPGKIILVIYYKK
jgi:hypothetical protein